MNVIQSIIQSNGKTIVNGVQIDVPANASISIRNDKVYVNGKLYECEELKSKEPIKIIINGNVENIDSDIDVEVSGQVTGNVTCGRDCEVGTDIGGNVTAGRDVECWHVGGSIMAGRDVYKKGRT